MIASSAAIDLVRHLSFGIDGRADKSLVEITLKYYDIRITVAKSGYH